MTVCLQGYESIQNNYIHIFSAVGLGIMSPLVIKNDVKITLNSKITSIIEYNKSMFN